MRRILLLLAVAMAVVLAASCLDVETAACADRLCPDGTVCSPSGDLCVTHEQIEDCESLEEGEGCGEHEQAVCFNRVCTVSVCGNGIEEPGEACDDGDTDSGDGCSSDCRSDETCGNGVIDLQVGEACDDGNTDDGDDCQSTCATPRCGDGVVDDDEVCDDGNLIFGDGCSGTCQSDETCGNAVVDPQSGEICDDGNLRSHDGCTSACTSEQLRWIDITPKVMSERVKFAHAYHPGLDRVVIFGADGTSGPAANQTWEWVDEHWELASPAVSPPAQEGGVALYDSIDDRIVMYGGFAPGMGGSPGTELYAYDGASWSVIPASGDAPELFDTSFVHDTDRDVYMVLGGLTATTSEGARKTYEFDGTTWSEASSSMTFYANGRQPMVYDPDRKVVVAFGFGATAVTPETADEMTWEYYGGDWHPSAADDSTGPCQDTPPPDCTKDYRMVYDTDRDLVVWLGRDGHWEYDGSSWTQVGPGPGDGVWNQHGLVYDSKRQRVLAFLGQNAGVGTLGVWEYKGSTWNDITDDRVLPTGDNQRMALVGTEEAILVSDLDRGDGKLSTWRYNGRSYLPVDSTDAPAAGWPFGMAYDPVRDRLVLFIINDGDGLTWELHDGEWQKAPVSEVEPFTGATMVAYDASNQQLLRVKPDVGLVAWDGTSWSVVHPDSSFGPYDNERAGFAHDPSRSVMVLRGGRPTSALPGSLPNQTFEWDGTGWQLVDGLQSPLREYSPMAFVPAFDQLVQYSGAEIPVGFDQDDTWRYGGNDWVRVFPASATPGPRSNHSLLFYPALAGAVLVGGNGDTTDDTWILRYQGLTPDEVCYNGGDDDGDGLIDCDDPDCDPTAVCTSP